ncbi:MAG: fibro-slime domain-containing protein [Fibrobacteres bacterium]|nr:fibro-slime domain-containing protein [Fibrobacterota bacterium]
MTHPASCFAHRLPASGRFCLGWLAFLGALGTAQGAGRESAALAQDLNSTESLTARLEGTLYDYKIRDLRGLDTTVYFPFSDPVGTGPIAGLLAPRLDREGRPVWSGKAICSLQLDSTRPCEQPHNAPDRWFVSQPSRNLPIPFALTLSGSSETLFSYADSFFFPLDTFRVLPGTSTDNPFFDQQLGQNMANHNFGFCMELHGMVEPTAGGKISITADDDTWVFLDSMLVVDMGGHHPSQSQMAPLEPPSAPNSTLVSLDIFHCDRLTDESLFALSIDGSIHPAGPVEPKPPTSALVAHDMSRKALRLHAIAKTLSVVAPAGQAWSLELRGLDGRLQRSITGTGTAMVSLTNSGVTVAMLRSGGKTITGRVVLAK